MAPLDKNKRLDTFEETIDGWLVMTPHHPETKRPMVFWSTFSSCRNKAIKNFVEDSLISWADWKKAYGFRCVRASSTIRLSASVENLKRMGL